MDAVTAAKTVSVFGTLVSEEALAVRPLNIAAFLYLSACLSYFIAVARSGNNSQGFWNRMAQWLMTLGFASHTLGMAGRWKVGGLDHPPWTNLYESLVGFAWMLSLFHQVSMRKWKIPLVGAATAPLVFLLMGMSVMTPNKSVEPLIPALQSNWLKIHVVFGMISYAGFTTAAGFAFLHLIRNKVSMSKIGAGLAIVVLCNLGVAGGNELFHTGKFFMAKTVVRQGPDGKDVYVKDSYREHEGGPVITRMEEVPHANLALFLCAAAFLSSAVIFITRRKNGMGPESGALDLDDTGRMLYYAGLFFMLVFFAAVGWGLNSSATLTLQSNPYLVMLLFMTFFFCAVYGVVTTRYAQFVNSLPSADRLDELSYKNILFAFPFQAMLLVTGAVWAYYAWGRSWGWDPKEVGALITWIVYLIYLHGKLLMGWKPSVLSFVAICGFVVMVFAFLGVNLVLSGLHSYGAV